MSEPLNLLGILWEYGEWQDDHEPSTWEEFQAAVPFLRDENDPLIPLLEELWVAEHNLSYSPITMGASFGCDCGCGGDSLTDQDYADLEAQQEIFDSLSDQLRAAALERGFVVAN